MCLGLLDALDQVGVVAALAQLHLDVDEARHRRIRRTVDQDVAVALENRLVGRIASKVGGRQCN